MTTRKTRIPLTHRSLKAMAVIMIGLAVYNLLQFVPNMMVFVISDLLRISNLLIGDVILGYGMISLWGIFFCLKIGLLVGIFGRKKWVPRVAVEIFVFSLATIILIHSKMVYSVFWTDLLEKEYWPDDFMWEYGIFIAHAAFYFYVWQQKKIFNK